MVRPRLIPIALAVAMCSAAAQASDLSYLKGLLDATPAGGWVKANTNVFTAASPTGADAAPSVPSGPIAVTYAWAGMAWDGSRGNILLFGGGHANYVGNEVYIWQGSDGTWTRGSLPSKVDLSTGFVLGAGAPQSSHTYQTTIYAPGTDRLVVFGGAAWNGGGAPSDANGRTGAWWWNPSLADPNKVGGGDNTGWDSTRAGSNSWQVRPYDPWVGMDPLTGRSFANGTSAYRSEGGKDVVYLTLDQNSSGLPALFRYELGTPNTPDSWSQVGIDSGATFLSSGAAAIDTAHGLFVRTAMTGGSFQNDLAVWDLSKNNAANPSLNKEVGVKLVDTNGGDWVPNFSTSVAYDSATGQLVFWDGTAGGTVWTAKAEFLQDGSLDTVWTVHKAESTTAAQPKGNFGDGVLGKWEYAPELGAFIAMDTPDLAAGDAGIWLYKPLAAVPEASTTAMLTVGLLGLGLVARRRRRVA
ncbi:hypothetical protein PFX98_19700 [Paucibacter sediminis]|uniref:PEP-CTERM sorting domain-containing protein n=1 Tax=Paucibacter sediminis TaxID=3019553 RepID=A0AA95SNC7_9BURK|nr:hypothetical protein [Paucibacter sp. S2-9]WIT11105.1 hypothetical protein PFX98_19700 [Paucibacter sp. S2-9]